MIIYFLATPWLTNEIDVFVLLNSVFFGFKGKSAATPSKGKKGKGKKDSDTTDSPEAGKGDTNGHGTPPVSVEVFSYQRAQTVT